MIPVRVRLAGFLSYREPQELTFESASLWLLTGANGSGKSALFDAITWALFGHHRGGSQNAGELLHKACDLCEVELDFQSGDDLFRIERTLKRGKSSVGSTFQIRRQQDGLWFEVPETNRKSEFDAWIHERIGVSYDAFTASTLLRQGHAEKLLDATPKGRAEVLANVVRLEHFQKLHERANQEKLKCKAIAEALAAQSEFVGSVSDDEVATAERNRRDAEAAVDAARRVVDECEQLRDAVRQANQLHERFAEAHDKVEHAEALLGESAAIEADYARLQELAAILPAAETVVVTRGKASESEHRTERFLKQQESARQLQENSERSLAVAKARKQELAKALAADETRLATLGQRLRALASTQQTVKLAEEQSAEIERLEREAAAFPKTLHTQLVETQALVDRLEKLSRDLPLAKRLQQDRADRVDAVGRRGTAQTECERIRREGEAARADHDALVKQLEDAEAELERVNANSAEAETRKRLAEAAFESLATLAGKSTCHFCGLPMTAKHLKEEKTRRERERSKAVAAFDDLKPEWDAAKANVAALKGREAVSNERLAQLRQDYKEHASAQTSASRDLERHDRAIAEAVAALTPAIADCDPKQTEIEIAAFDDAKRRLRILQDQSTQNAALVQQTSQLRLSRDRLTSQLPADASALREEQQAQHAEEAARIQAVKAGKKTLDDTDREIEKLARQAHDALTEFTDFTGRLRTEESTREHCGEIVGRALAKLSDEWRSKIEAAGLADYNAWKESHSELTAKRAAVSFRQLEAARGHLESLREEANRLEDHWRAAIPTTVEEAAAKLTAAQTALQMSEATAATARAACQRLDESQRQSRRLSEQVAEASRHLARWKRNAELLGRDGIQRHLVRDAERVIVAHANEILQKLADGSLTLSLADEGGAEKALELQAICTSISPEPIDVAFLSGSQRFRIAVALALGLGEYASDRRPPCLMIDEGFGSLDRAGRAAMIRELHLLESHLARILVVSHDDDFAAAFENAYRFELIDGATRVTRK